MSSSKRKQTISLIMLALCAVVLIVFESANFVLSNDQIANDLLMSALPRLFGGICLIVVVALLGYPICNPFKKGWAKGLFWAIPCLLVALANFPFTALYFGQAEVVRLDLIGIFALDCLAIGLFEEAIFRGLIQTVALERLQNKQNGIFWSVVASSAIFGLVHFSNLFMGGGFTSTLLQVGYSFLIGAMLSVTLIKTENIWLAVFLHAVFDFGGKLIIEIGQGYAWDTGFWILTIVCGGICALHVINTLRKTTTCYTAQKLKTDQ